MKNLPRALTCVTLGLSMLFMGACQKRPVMYPNEFLAQAGEQRLQADIDECMRRAEEAKVAADTGTELAKETATGAAVGAATGAVVGAIFGSAGRGAASGAAGGGVAALTRKILRSDKPDPLIRAYVDRCLSEKGYEPLGWK